MILTCIFLIGAASIVYSMTSFNRRCRVARETYDPIRAGSPRGLIH